MELAWKTDEGYEVFYRDVWRRYRDDAPDHPAKAEEELKGLLDERRYVTACAAQSLAKLDALRVGIEETKAEIGREEQELERERQMFAIGQKAENERAAQRLSASLDSRRAGLRHKLEETFRLESEAGGTFGKEAELERAAKLAVVLRAAGLVSGSGLETDLAPRNCLEPWDIPDADYARIMKSFILRNHAEVFWKEGALAFAEGDPPGPRAERWDGLAHAGYDLLRDLSSLDFCLARFNDRRFLSFGHGFDCVVSAYRNASVRDDGVYHLGFSPAGMEVSHPTLPGKKVLPPNTFLVFNAAVTIRHEFALRGFDIPGAG